MVADGARRDGMFPRALGERGKIAHGSRDRAAKRIAIALALTGAVAVLSACGGSDAERQDVDEPSGEFPVEVKDAKFPTPQRRHALVQR